MRLLVANCQIQNYDNFTRASARWKLKNYGNYGNFCRFFMKYYDYYEYFFQKNDHREPSPMINAGILGISQPPRPLLILRRGTYLPPNPLPTSGGGLTAPTRRSFIKVCSTRSKGRHIAHASLDAIILRNKVAIFYAIA